MTQLFLLPDLVPDHRSEPAERLHRHGASALSLPEVLGLLIELDRVPSLRSVTRSSLHSLAESDHRTLQALGFAERDASVIVACVELATRLARERLGPRPLDPLDRLVRYLTLRYFRRSQEQLGAVFLDSVGALMTDEVLFRGGLSRTTAEVRVVLHRALTIGASSFLLFHNHPSGDPSPSVEDLDFTRRLQEAAQVMDLAFTDHLILGGGGRWVSLRLRGSF